MRDLEVSRDDDLIPAKSRCETLEQYNVSAQNNGNDDLFSIKHYKLNKCLYSKKIASNFKNCSFFTYLYLSGSLE